MDTTIVCTSCSDNGEVHFLQKLDEVDLLVCSNCGMCIPKDEEPEDLLKSVPDGDLIETDVQQSLDPSAQQFLEPSIALADFPMVPSVEDGPVFQVSYDELMAVNSTEVLTDTDLDVFNRSIAIVDEITQSLDSDVKPEAPETTSSDTSQLDQDQPTKILNYITFKNNGNLCWLNCIMHMVAHSKILRNQSNDSDCWILRIIAAYERAMAVANGRRVAQKRSAALAILNSCQSLVLDYLKPLVQHVHMKPNSPFCALLNLVKQDKLYRSLFNTDIVWNFKCLKCQNVREQKWSKELITLTSVQTFQPESPTVLCKCPFCQEANQIRTLSYVNVAPCLLFHFESGAGAGNLKRFNFSLKEYEYELSGVVVTVKSAKLNHYITYIRNMEDNTWLICDDLKRSSCQFKHAVPPINLSNVYIMFFERSVRTESESQLYDMKSAAEIVEKATVEVPHNDITDIFTPDLKQISALESSWNGVTETVSPVRENDVLTLEISPDSITDILTPVTKKTLKSKKIFASEDESGKEAVLPVLKQSVTPEISQKVETIVVTKTARNKRRNASGSDISQNDLTETAVAPKQKARNKRKIASENVTEAVKQSPVRTSLRTRGKCASVDYVYPVVKRKTRNGVRQDDSDAESPQKSAVRETLIAKRTLRTYGKKQTESREASIDANRSSGSCSYGEKDVMRLPVMRQCFEIDLATDDDNEISLEEHIRNSATDSRNVNEIVENTLVTLFGIFKGK